MSFNEEKKYDIAIGIKQHVEQRRDSTNSFYISLFSAIIGVIPFIPTFTKETHISVSASILFLSFVGFVLSYSWIFLLLRTNKYLVGIEKYIFDLENKSDMKFLSEISIYLDKKKAPIKITKQQLLIPFLFCIIFAVIFVISFYAYKI